MNDISKYEKEKILQLLECSEEELKSLTNKSIEILEKGSGTYDMLLKILQEGLNIREATLSGIIIEGDNETGLARRITRVIEGGSLIK